ncbi:DUF7384 family protein [Halobellus rubicundus]|uniref:Uncharacterized protein n=1 Tax=Halobellus rubicundus TaxID=2996466 RepID=A0ABD5M7W7_9EURY
MESWGALFDRAAEADVDEAAIGRALERVRDRERDGSDATGSDGDVSPPAESGPARVVADADVLAADLLVDGDARRALDHLRAHSWTALVASDPLVDDAAAVVADLADDALAADWRERVDAWREPVSQPLGDHPALASAYRGGAMHLLSLDERLLSTQASATLGGRLSVSARHPRAFATLFDPEGLYGEVAGGEYPGPDRDPRE